MTIAFIRQIEDALYQLDQLANRAKKDNSEFQWRIDAARDAIKSVSATYHEVLARDTNEDTTYTPPLKEIK
jgi:hypothetical protein